MITNYDLCTSARETVVSDFSRILEQDFVSDTSEKGKWWLRPYRTRDGLTGRMRCVEERDKERLESCIVPPIALPLNLSGFRSDTMVRKKSITCTG